MRGPCKISSAKLEERPGEKRRRSYLPGRRNKKNRQAFRLLPGQENKQKLRCPHVLVPVPMGLPSTSAEWNKKDSDEWCRKNVPDWHSGRKIIDANGQHLVTKAANDDDMMISYANEEGKQLYRVTQRGMMSDETYPREDLDLTDSLRRNAAATTLAASSPTESWD
jgi:hypothetical protein